MNSINFDLYYENEELNMIIDDSCHISFEGNSINVDSISKMLYVYDIELYKELLNDLLSFSNNQLKEAYEKVVGYPDNLERIKDLKDCYKHGLIIPFVGAGLSIQCGAPGWRRFLHSLAPNSETKEAKHIELLLSAGKLEEVAGALYSYIGKEKFCEKMDHAFSIEYPTLGGVNYLPRLSIDQIVTTNFDRLIEKAFSRKGLQLEINKGTEASDIRRPGTIVLTKIHGDFNYNKTRVFLKNEYEKAYFSTDGAVNFDLELPKFLKNIYQNYRLLFIGCSLNLDTTMKVFKSVKDGNESKRFKHYALSEYIEDEGQRIIRENFLNSHGIFPIWYEEGQHEQSIMAILASLQKK